VSAHGGAHEFVIVLDDIELTALDPAAEQDEVDFPEMFWTPDRLGLISHQEHQCPLN
jgi:hypothetical protein